MSIEGMVIKRASHSLRTLSPAMVDAVLPIAVVAIAVAGEVAVAMLDHRAPKWNYLMVAGGLLIGAFILSTVLLRSRSNAPTESCPQWIRLCTVLGAMAAAVLGQKATAVPDVVGLLIVLACVASIAGMGNSKLTAVVVLAAAGGSGWIVWSASPDKVQTWGKILLILWSVIATSVMVRGALRISLDLASSRVGIQALDNVMASASDVREGIRAGLPLIRGVIPVDHVVVLARSDGDRQAHPAGSWPQDEPGDENLGAMVGLDEAITSNRVVRVGRYSFLPIGRSSAGSMALAIRHDAPKGEAPNRWTRACEEVASCFSKLTARASFVDELRRESRTDPLTGLSNRRELLERLDTEMQTAARLRSPLVIAMLDLDHFKRYNDTYGHVRGDTLLRAISAIFISSIRTQDIAARYGGEEFVIVLPGTDVPGAMLLMERLRTSVSLVDRECTVTLSIGVTHWDGNDTAVELINRADKALYAAKENGRNRVVVAAEAAGA